MDNNLELLDRAKSYLEQLANGHDPISGDALPDDTVLNNVRISRCFFFVSDILRQVIENGGKVKQTPKQKLLPFAITEEEKARVEISAEPLQISKLCERINNQINTDERAKLKVTAFGEWLAEKGFLNVEIRNNKKYKKVTPSGEAVGIICEWRAYGEREYYQVSYSAAAQQFLLDNLDEIIVISGGETAV